MARHRAKGNPMRIYCERQRKSLSGGSALPTGLPDTGQAKPYQMMAVHHGAPHLSTDDTRQMATMSDMTGRKAGHGEMSGALGA